MPLQNCLDILLLRNFELSHISVHIHSLNLHLQNLPYFSQIFHLKVLTQFPFYSFDVINPPREKQKSLT